MSDSTDLISKLIVDFNEENKTNFERSGFLDLYNEQMAEGYWNPDYTFIEWLEDGAYNMIDQ